MSATARRSKRRARLHKRLAAYSAMAAGAVAAGTSAQAAPVVHDIPDVTISTNPGLWFNIVSGSTAVPPTSTTNPGAYTFGFVATASANGLYANYAGQGVAATVIPNTFASRFATSDRVGTGNNFNTNFAYLGHASTIGPWDPPPQSGFVGLKFQIAGADHFGWAQFTNNASLSLTLHAFGYETVAGAVSHIDPKAGAIPLPPAAALGLLGLGAVGVREWKRRRQADAA